MALKCIAIGRCPIFLFIPPIGIHVPFPCFNPFFWWGGEKKTAGGNAHMGIPPETSAVSASLETTRNAAFLKRRWNPTKRWWNTLSRGNPKRMGLCSGNRWLCCSSFFGWFFYRWWFRFYCFICTPIWGSGPILTIFLLDGLKPPASFACVVVFVFLDIFI